MTRKKLLIIDDSETNLLLFESMFENEPRIQVVLRNNGIDIVDFCLNDIPDLILLDLMMPVVDGFQVLQQLQSCPELMHIPIIIISALNGQKDIRKAIELGAHDYICKPIDFEENPIKILDALGLDPI
jgi:CheY-like chemotaxis protein